MVPAIDLLQDIEKVREAEVKFYETVVTWPAPPAQVPASTGQHPTRTNNEGRGQSEAHDGDELEELLFLSH